MVYWSCRFVERPPLAMDFTSYLIACCLVAFLLPWAAPRLFGLPQALAAQEEAARARKENPWT